MGRVLAVVIPAVGSALGLLWRYGRRPAPVPVVVRCPIHGIAYDTELEICPDCAKTQPAAGPETHHLGINTTGGAR